MSGRIADDGVADDQNIPLGPVKSDFSGGFTMSAHHDKRPRLRAHFKLVVQLGSLAARMRRVGGVDRRARSGAGADLVGGARVLLLVRDNRGAETGEIFSPARRLTGSLQRFRRVKNEIAVEIVSVRLGARASKMPFNSSLIPIPSLSCQLSATS